MKNVLFIVLDSITNNQLFNSECSLEKAPFLNTLRDKSITGDNMYSQAPYTEAALMSLLGSSDTLDDGGYMEKFKNKETVIDIFRKNGYKTFFPTYYPSIYPSHMYYGAKEVSYIEKFTFSHLWDYRFKHFQKYYLEKNTSEVENQMLKDMLEDNLNAWINLLDLLSKKDKKTVMMNNCVQCTGIKDTIKKIQEELKQFYKQPDDYLNQLFLEGENHKLFQLDIHTYIDKVGNHEFKEWFVKKNYGTFKRIKKEQLHHNFINSRLPIKKIVRNINNREIVKGLLAGYKNSLFDKDIMERITLQYDLFKAQRSFRSVADLTLDWIEKNNNSKTPWMAYVHVDDAHYPENFFTYDTQDKTIVEQEFIKINHFLDKLPRKYCGTIASDLSLLYCDSIIQMIFEKLEEKGILENTSIIITADHGFSYYFNPIREKYVISSYRENYNVPFIVYEKNIKPRKINGFLATKDIPATILDLANIKIPEHFKGQSLLNFEGRKFATLEYMGGGCPDLVRRPVVLGIRNEKYEVITEVFENVVNIKEVYDSKKDYYEQNNLAHSQKVNIDQELDFIKKRYEENMNSR